MLRRCKRNEVVRISWGHKSALEDFQPRGSLVPILEIFLFRKNTLTTALSQYTTYTSIAGFLLDLRVANNQNYRQ